MPVSSAGARTRRSGRRRGVEPRDQSAAATRPPGRPRAPSRCTCGRVAADRHDQAEHDPPVGQRRQPEPVAGAVGRVVELAAQQRVGHRPVQVHARRARGLPSSNRSGIAVVGVRPVLAVSRQRQPHHRLGAAGLDVQRLHVDRHQQPQLADQLRGPRWRSRESSVRPAGGEEPPRADRRVEQLGVEVGHDRLARWCRSSWAVELDLPLLEAHGDVEHVEVVELDRLDVRSGSPNTCRYGKRSICSANSVGRASARPRWVFGGPRRASGRAASACR